MPVSPIPSRNFHSIRPNQIAGFVCRIASVFPEKKAVVWNGGQLSYRQLDEESNRVAGYLMERGVRGLVGIAIERSPEMLIGLLGILKAGAAYLPLDLSAPMSRNQTLLNAVGAKFGLVSRTAPSPPPAPGIEWLFVEDCGDRPSPQPEAKVGPDDLCYVLFTSGSTGTPKAVGVPHRAVLRLVCGADYADLGPDQVWLQMAPLDFDASTLEIWAPLCNGGCLALLPPGPQSLDEIGCFIKRHGVTSAWFTAGLFCAMADESIKGFAPLSQLLTGGDVVPPAQARAVLDCYPDLDLVNGYGPTENTTFTCCHRISLSDCAGDAIPVGKAISGTTVFILSDSLTVCPPGVAGELCAGGDGLALGYLNDAEQTVERFIQHPEFGRIYRTGDRCLMRGDGVIEFLGRMDDQVKIRGFRVEPGEVESVLSTHPSLRQVAVVPMRVSGCEAFLAACVVPAVFDEKELRGFVAARLPSHMIPREFLGFETLPLTPNGKINRRELAAEVEAAFIVHPTSAPNSAERGGAAHVRAVWEELLGHGSFDDGKGFFECGGDSILLVRLHAKLAGVSANAPSLTELFELTTIRSQVARIAGTPSPATTTSATRAAHQLAAMSRRRSLRK